MVDTYNGFFSVFSTYVEVIPMADLMNDIYKGILHVCGGDPIIPFKGVNVVWYSPRMWR